MKHPLTLLCAIVLASCLVSLRGLSDTGATLRVLQSFPVHVTDKDEPAESRAARLAEIATAIDAATSDPTERAALLTLVRMESGAAGYVHRGECSTGPRGKFECDSGRAKGHWQLHANADHPTIPDFLGEQAKIALRLWKSGRVACRRVVTDEIAGAFQSYGTGGKCSPSAWSSSRADHLRRIAGRL